MRRLIQVIACALCTTSINATTIHVPSDQPAIKAGIDSAPAGDTLASKVGTQ